MNNVDFNTDNFLNDLAKVEDWIEKIAESTHIVCNSDPSQRSQALLGWLKQHPKNAPEPAITDQHTDNLQSMCFIRQCLTMDYQQTKIGEIVADLHSPENTSLKQARQVFDEAGQSENVLEFPQARLIEFAFADLNNALNDLSWRLEAV